MPDLPIFVFSGKPASIKSSLVGLKVPKPTPNLKGYIIVPFTRTFFNTSLASFVSTLPPPAFTKICGLFSFAILYLLFFSLYAI